MTRRHAARALILVFGLIGVGTSFGCGASGAGSVLVAESSQSQQAPSAEQSHDEETPPVDEAEASSGSAVDCLVTDDDGRPQWFGAEPVSLVRMEAELWAAGSMDTIGGLTICSHYDGIIAHVKAGSTSTIAEMEIVGANYPDYSLSIIEVPRSMNQMLALVDAVNQSGYPGDAALIVSVSPQETTGGLKLVVAGDQAEAEAAKEAVTRILGPDVPLSVTADPEHQAPVRYQAPVDN